MAVPMGEITRALVGVRRRLCVKWGFVDMDVYEQEYRFYYFARCPYSHIIDDDRRLNAERMEAAFYSGRQATPEPVQPAATESSADDKELLLKLLQNPEMAALLKSLAKTL